MFIFLITIVLNNAARTLTTRGDRAHISFLRDCDKGSVRVEKYSLINLPTSIEIQGRNCAGPDSAYQGYRAEIWDHFFWLLS